MAILVEGARRVGKSTVVEHFAKNEYESYILIDFYRASKGIRELFDDLTNLDDIFMRLQQHYHTILKPRQSLIIFTKCRNVLWPGKPSNISLLMAWENEQTL